MNLLARLFRESSSTIARVATMVLAGLLVSVSLAEAAGADTKKPAKPAASQGHATLSVEGMACHLCEPRAQKTLQEVPGVTQAKVDYSTRTAVVTYDPAKVKIEELIFALKKVGFTASITQTKYICPTCQATYQAAGACLICETTLQPIESEVGGQSEKGGPKP